MAVWATWLADALRETGYPVVEVSGWKTRGTRGMNAVEGITPHHTVGAKTGNYPSLNVVKNGRAGLSGPLSQLGLGRDGTWYVIAAGRSNHAGTSSWAGFSNLNGSFIGVEAESVGNGKDWTAAQLDSYARGTAAVLKYIRRNSSRVGAHKEICIPRGRKIDPAGINMNQFRATVQGFLDNPSTLRKGGIVAKPTPDKVYKVGERELKNTVPQMSGPDVVAVQGWAGVKTDGFYGPSTAKAISAVQAKVKARVTGTVNAETWKHYKAWVVWRADLERKAALAKPKPVAPRPVTPAPKPVLTVPASAKWTKGRGYFKKGDNSSGIAKWQRRMVERGYGLDVDGSLGPDSDRVLRYFQKLVGLPVTGRLDEKTWNASWTVPIK